VGCPPSSQVPKWVLKKKQALESDRCVTACCEGAQHGPILQVCVAGTPRCAWAASPGRLCAGRPCCAGTQRMPNGCTMRSSAYTRCATPGMDTCCGACLRGMVPSADQLAGIPTAQRARLPSGLQSLKKARDFEARKTARRLAATKEQGSGSAGV